MNDNLMNITNLIHRQLDVLDRYHTNVNDSTERIDNCIQELLSLQQGRDRDARLFRRRTNGNSDYRIYNNPMNRVHSYIPPSMPPSPPPPPPSVSRQNRSTTATNTVPTRRPFQMNTTRRPAVHRRWFENRRNTNLRNTNRRRNRHRMTLQEFINSTLSQGNPRIPATENAIMQQTTIININDLSGTNITRCPISLTTFDNSTNILRINQCQHVFESDSLIRWFRLDSRCPLCRYNINTPPDSSGNVNDDVNDEVNGEVNDDVNGEVNGNNNNNEPENHHSTTADVEEDTTDEIEDDFDNEIPSNSTIIYDISFSIPHLFGPNIENTQMNSIIDSITNTITNSMTQSLSDYTNTLNSDEELVVEEMIIQTNDGRENTEEEEEGGGEEEEEVEEEPDETNEDV